MNRIKMLLLIMIPKESPAFPHIRVADKQNFYVDVNLGSCVHQREMEEEPIL
jgi:hypothetical protein